MKVRRSCSVENCSRNHYARGLCNPHYQRWHKHGRPLGSRSIRNKIRISSCADIMQVISYNPKSGVFKWKVDGSDSKSGEEAGTILKSKGDRFYRVIRISGKSYYAHRLAFFMMRGEWPENQVDHRDNDGLNNKWNNLRIATPSKNQANSRMQVNNTTGFKGVSRKRKRFVASIAVDGKQRHLGTFDTAEEAHIAYRDASEKYHGEFSRC